MRRLLKDKLLVLSSSVGSKLLGLLASVLIVRLLPTKDFAEWSYYKTFIVFLLPISFLGMEQVLLRYAYLKGVDKKKLKTQTFSIGIVSSSLVIFIGVLVVFLIRPKNFQNTLLLIFVFLQLISVSFNLFYQYFFRIVDDFYKYSKIIFATSLYVSMALIIGAFINVETMALLATLAYLVYYLTNPIKINFRASSLYKITKEQLKYGVNIGIGGLLNKGIFVLDVIYIANMLNNTEGLAGYKVITLLPFNLILVANSILIVDFGAFVNFKRKDILKYLLSYWKKGITFLVPTGVILFFFHTEIINLLFGVKYVQYSSLMFYYFLFIALIILLRSPVGQILNALGYAGFNSIMTVLQTLFLGLLFIIPLELSLKELIFYFGAVVLFLTTIQFIKLFKI
ncbi:hypothetical protein BTO06_02935 [Tenacibaculum sp. SZ-18]|uniref:oligosaccharide flippase family protein n=1 Tax=Tenacibaculum sp. SZ-18 TaxID=754423 RepID=UPI000C2D373F|nr:oligosaccharide flippase family protein [Tenacibaculum sp. SZ-18]AUC14166.1 hypothetical protein BTO06_02935 [Tenacibaculum sp. SZ-18]